MVRRVKAYLSKMPVISDEDTLHRLSLEVEAPPQTSATNLTLASNSSMQSLSSVAASQAQNTDHAKSLSTAGNSTSSISVRETDTRKMLITDYGFFCIKHISLDLVHHAEKVAQRRKPDAFGGEHDLINIPYVSDLRRQEEHQFRHQIW